MVLSNEIIITVTDVIVPTIVIAADQTTICLGSTVNFTSTISGGGTSPSYQWYVNGIAEVGATGDTWTSNTLADGDVVTCELTSSEACADPAMVLSNEITITVTDAIVPTIVIVADQTTICLGSTVNFTSTISGGGTSPSYQWYVNGIAEVGATGDTWTSSTLADGDIVTCELTSSEACADPAMVLSNEITITVTDVIIPTIVIVADQTTICLGSTVNFTSTITGGGTSPSYQWYVNGIAEAGATGDTWTSNTLADGDIVTCELTSSDACADPAMVLSNEIIITVMDEIVPTFVQIGPLCQNSTAPALPATSIEGITGTWNPSVINTSVIGSSTYTFTPDAGQCALTTTMEIEVTNEIVPEFIAIGPLCLDSDAPELPLISENGINGTWNPATINTSVAGITTYTFTPYADQCAVQTVMIVSVSSPSIIALDLEPTTFWLPNGSAIIIADGTAVPLVYSITGNGSDWQAGNEFNNLAAGPYVAWVMDANGCMDSLSFEILNRVEGDVILAADTVSYCMNIPVIIPVDGNNFTEISSFYIELEFDPSLMSFNSIVQVHPALVGGTFSPAIVGNILQIRYSIFAGSATVPAGESLFSLNFDALQPGLTEMRWNLLSCEIFESSGQQVPGIYVNGQAEIYPAPTIYAFGSGEYCEGDSLTLQVGTSSAEQLSWVWTGPTGHQHFDPEWQLGSLGMNDNGQFTVVATNPYFCSDTKTVDLLVNPKPIIYLGYADTICYGQAAILDPGSGFVSYLWHDGSTNQTMFAIDPGLYFVSVMDEKGCSAVDSVALVPCIIDLLIPNAFTPNSDGLNDIFRPIFRGWEPSKYYMQVYSRWGQLIFESTAFQIGWDGTVDGVMAPPGVYTYVISFEAPSYVTRIVSSPVTGSVTLIR
jgi:gliding motility-associated-like protein